MRSLSPSLLLIVLAACPVGVVAQEAEPTHPLLASKWSIRAGTMKPTSDISLSVDGEISGINLPIDIDAVFGLGDAKSSEAYELQWRFGELWSLRLQNFEIINEASAVLPSDIGWGDLVFNEGSFVTIGSGFDVTRLFFGRKVKWSDDYEIGVGAGVHWLEIRNYIFGDIIINGFPVGFGDGDAGVEGPLPTVGAWFTKAFNDHWAMEARFDWLNVRVDPFDGLLVDATLGINYHLNDHFGLGLQYNYFELDVIVRDSGWRGQIDTKDRGPYLFLSVHF